MTPLLEQPESARPPCALQVEIGAVGQQQIEQRQVLRGPRDRTAVEMANGFVNGGAHLRVRFQQRADAFNVAGMERDEEPLHRCLFRSQSIAIKHVFSSLARRSSCARGRSVRAE